MPKQKPLLFAEDTYDPSAFDPNIWEQRSLDPSRIPGYSEIVQANDLAGVDEFDFQHAQRKNATGSGAFRNKEQVYGMIGAHPQELPVNFAWLPISNPGGGGLSPSQARLLDHYTSREGFRLVTVKTQAEFTDTFGYGFPPTARLEADGSIRRGVDLALYVRPGEVARKWERHRAQLAADAEQSALPDRLSAGAEATETVVKEERKFEYIRH